MEKGSGIGKLLLKNKELVISTIVLFVIVFGGFYIRVVKLGEASVSFVEPLHIYAAKSILETGEPTLPSGVDYSRSLWFTQFVALSFKLFGVNDFAARFPSAIFGTLSIILVFFIGRGFFGTVSGLIAAFIVAFVPFQVVWSRECRMYIMFQFFFLLGFFAFYMGFEKTGFKDQKSFDVHQKPLYKRFWLGVDFLLSHWNLDWRWLLVSLISFYISFKVHELTGIYFFSILFYLSSMLFFTLVSQGFKGATQSKYLFSLLILVALSGVGFVIFPQFSSSMVNLFNISPSWYMGPREVSLYYFDFLMGPLLFPVGAFFIIGTIQIVTRAHKAGFYTLICIFVPLIMHSFVILKQPRYIFNIFPLIILVSSYGLYNLFEVEFKEAYHSIQNRGIRRFSSKNLIYILLIGLFFFWFLPSFRQSLKVINYPIQAALGGEHHAQWKEACRYMKNFRKSGDVIISTIPLAALYHCGAVDYALDKVHYIGSSDYSLDEPTSSSNLEHGIKKDGFYIDYYTGSKAIISLTDLKRVFSENPRGWLILDKQRFIQNKTVVPEDIREFINENLVNHTTKADGTMLIFSWDESSLAESIRH